MADDLMCAEAPRSHWQIGPYRFARYTREQVPTGRYRWECSNTVKGRGVSNKTNPLSAFVALLRWQNKPARPT